MPVCSADKTNLNKFMVKFGAEPWHHRMKDYLIDKLHISGNEEGFSDANASAHLKRIKDMLSGPNGTTFWPEPECLNHSLGFKRKGKLLQFKFDSLKSGSLTENTVHNSNKSSYDLEPINLSDMRFLSALFEESEALINSMKIEEILYNLPGLNENYRKPGSAKRIKDIRGDADPNKYKKHEATELDKDAILKAIMRDLDIKIDINIQTLKIWEGNVLEEFTKELVKVPVGKLNIFFSLLYILYFTYKVHENMKELMTPENLILVVLPNILLNINIMLELKSGIGTDIVPGPYNFIKKIVTDVPALFEMVKQRLQDLGLSELTLSDSITNKQTEYDEWEEDFKLNELLADKTIEDINKILETTKDDPNLSGAVERYKLLQEDLALDTKLDEILSKASLNHDYQPVKDMLKKEFDKNVFERNKKKIQEKLKYHADTAGAYKDAEAQQQMIETIKGIYESEVRYGNVANLYQAILNRLEDVQKRLATDEEKTYIKTVIERDGRPTTGDVTAEGGRRKRKSKKRKSKKRKSKKRKSKKRKSKKH
jgi:hypothetical protein